MIYETDWNGNITRIYKKERLLYNDNYIYTDPQNLSRQDKNS